MRVKVARGWGVEDSEVVEEGLGKRGLEAVEWVVEGA